MAGMGVELQAQDMMNSRRASQFDIGVYGGGAYTTDWFTTPMAGGEEEGWAPGFSAIAGAIAQFWFTPSLGLRLHGAYLPQNLPEAENFESDKPVVNGYLYDLDLVFRPFFSQAPGFMPSVYFFLGGGGYTADIGDFMTPGVDDSDAIACIRQPEWVRSGVCVSTSPEFSSVGMGVVGVGADFFPLGPLGLFGELAVHGYDSPAHVRQNGPGEDKFTFTPRAVLGLKAMFGDIMPPAPVVLPPPPMPTPMPEPVAPTPEPVRMQEIQVCVLQDGNLTNVTGMYNPAAGDTTVNGQPFATAFPTGAQYAANATWFINNEPVMFQNRRFVKYGLPRVLGVNEVTRVGDFMGVPVFAEAGQTRPDVIYVPVRPGCEFQPYQTEVKTGGVRGE
jgi:hypothetical protein